MALPEELEIQFNEDMKRYEEEKNMAYVTSAERIVIKKGREEGQRIKALKIGRELKARGMYVKEIAEITGLTIEEVEALTPD